MSMPRMPEINVNPDDSKALTIASIAMEGLALSHILNAEGEKLQLVLGTLTDSSIDLGEITFCDIMEVNKSIQSTLRDVIKTEMLLQFKLEDILGMDDSTCQS